MGGGEAGAYSRGGAYFKFWPIGGALIQRGRLLEGGGGALIQRFTVIQCTDIPLSLSFPQSFNHSGLCRVNLDFFFEILNLGIT